MSALRWRARCERDLVRKIERMTDEGERVGNAAVHSLMELGSLV